MLNKSKKEREKGKETDRKTKSPGEFVCTYVHLEIVYKEPCTWISLCVYVTVMDVLWLYSYNIFLTFSKSDEAKGDLEGAKYST